MKKVNLVVFSGIFLNLVIPTNEEVMIARDVMRLANL